MTEYGYVLQRGDAMGLETLLIKDAGKSYRYIDPDTDVLRINEVPVGSVEFCRRIMQRLSIPEPFNISYPSELYPYLDRKVRFQLYKDCHSNAWIKPVITKQFNCAPKHYLDGNLSINPGHIVYASEPMDIISETRFYIHNKKIIGYSQYGEHAELDPPISLIGLVETMVNKYTESFISYTIDMAICSDYHYRLIECNDAWAIGFYSWGTMQFSDYIEFITDRWKEMTKYAHNNTNIR